MTTTTTKPTLIVVGPGQDGHHIHAPGCKDIARDERRCGNSSYTIHAATRKEIVTAIYDPNCFEYDGDTDEWEGFDDLKLLSCVGKLPRA